MEVPNHKVVVKKSATTEVFNDWLKAPVSSWLLKRKTKLLHLPLIFRGYDSPKQTAAITDDNDTIMELELIKSLKPDVLNSVNWIRAYERAKKNTLHPYLTIFNLSDQIVVKSVCYFQPTCFGYCNSFFVDNIVFVHKWNYLWHNFFQLVLTRISMQLWLLMDWIRLSESG